MIPGTYSLSVFSTVLRSQASYEESRQKERDRSHISRQVREEPKSFSFSDQRGAQSGADPRLLSASIQTVISTTTEVTFKTTKWGRMNLIYIVKVYTYHQGQPSTLFIPATPARQTVKPVCLIYPSPFTTFHSTYSSSPITQS